MGKMLQNVSSLKPLGQLKPKLPRNDHWKVLYTMEVFYANRKSKMAATARNRLETTNQNESKLDRNVQWIGLYKV
jgi:hypothetical protein